MRKYLAFSLISFFILASGCVSTYEFAANEPKAELESVGLGSVGIYKGNKFYQLPKSSNGKSYKVPAGNRIVLVDRINFSQSSGYFRMSLSCSPSLTFIPEKDGSYLINSYLDDKSCYVELVKSRSNSPTGLEREHSIRPVRRLKKG